MEGTAGGELINLSSDDGGMEETKLGDKEKANSLNRRTRFLLFLPLLLLGGDVELVGVDGVGDLTRIPFVGPVVCLYYVLLLVVPGGDV